MAIAASESFSQRNQGCSVDEGIESWLDIAEAGAVPPASARRSRSQRPSVVRSKAKCRVARVRDIAERLAAGEPDEIAVADTIGVAVPTQVTELIGALRASLPRVTSARAFPQHAQHRARQCLRGGRSRRAALDASCGGIGGCPFAPAATGNIPTEDLDLHAASHGCRDRRGSAGAARDQPVAAADARSRRAGHVGEGRHCFPRIRAAPKTEHEFTTGESRWRSRLATRCPRALSRRRPRMESEDLTTDAALQGQDGRVVLGAGCVHADLRCQASAGLRREGRRLSRPRASTPSPAWR